MVRWYHRRKRKSLVEYPCSHAISLNPSRPDRCSVDIFQYLSVLSVNCVWNAFSDGPSRWFKKKKKHCEVSATPFHIKLPFEKGRDTTLSGRWHIYAAGLVFGILEKVHGQLWPWILINKNCFPLGYSFSSKYLPLSQEIQQDGKLSIRSGDWHYPC